MYRHFNKLLPAEAEILDIFFMATNEETKYLYVFINKRSFNMTDLYVFINKI